MQAEVQIIQSSYDMVYHYTSAAVHTSGSCLIKHDRQEALPSLLLAVSIPYNSQMATPAHGTLADELPVQS